VRHYTHMIDSKKCESCCDRLGESSDGVLWLAPPDAYTYWCKGCVHEVALKESIEEYLRVSMRGGLS
jgi:hypothetical protein